MPTTKTKSHASVWDSIADTPGESACMQLKSELLFKLEKIIQSKTWVSAEVAVRCGLEYEKYFV